MTVFLLFLLCRPNMSFTLFMSVCPPPLYLFYVFAICHCQILSTSVSLFFTASGTFLVSLVTQGQRDGEVEEEKREKPKATFEGEKLKELTEGEADVIGDVINPNGLPVQNGLDVDVKEFG